MCANSGDKSFKKLPRPGNANRPKWNAEAKQAIIDAGVVVRELDTQPQREEGSLYEAPVLGRVHIAGPSVRKTSTKPKAHQSPSTKEPPVSATVPDRRRGISLLRQARHAPPACGP